MLRFIFLVIIISFWTDIANNPSEYEKLLRFLSRVFGLPITFRENLTGKEGEPLPNIPQQSVLQSFTVENAPSDEEVKARELGRFIKDSKFGHETDEFILGSGKKEVLDDKYTYAWEITSNK